MHVLSFEKPATCFLNKKKRLQPLCEIAGANLSRKNCSVLLSFDFAYQNFMVSVTILTPILLKKGRNPSEKNDLNLCLTQKV